MSHGRCRQCGLSYEQADGTLLCYLGRRPAATASGQPGAWQCHFFQERIVEDGVPLTAAQHYLIKQAELERKK
ncbi:MAG: hypothetical protein ACUVTU_11405 [Desulfurispora sp.]|uniref:hypothetical protein n=1 Tax=Desulfurispora sp. TaxID=3014275 RepID=UPI00404A8EEF